jgi:AcrR family transcriptional regulator
MSATEQKRKIDPKSGGESKDRRFLRTRRMIQQALTDLMHAKPYEDITVQDIIDSADIGRSTFYAHYPDKEDAAKEILEQMMGSITRGVKTETGEGPPAFPIAEMFRHLRDQTSKVGVWQSTRGRDYLFSVGQMYWNRRIERELKAHAAGGGAPKVPYPVMAQMLTGAATALLTWWMKNKMPYSPEEMQAMFDWMMMPGIRTVCGK